jgi:hypothetical protein
MFEQLRTWSRELRSWLASVRATATGGQASAAPDEADRFLIFFRPDAAQGLPVPVQQALAAGTFTSILALGGVALLFAAGALLALFGIYMLVTEVLGLEVDVDPRFWRDVTA